MSNVIFEQWYEDMYGEKTFPNISDENNFKEACRAAYNFALDSKWNYNISEAPRDGSKIIVIMNTFHNSLEHYIDEIYYDSEHEYFGDNDEKMSKEGWVVFALGDEFLIQEEKIVAWQIKPTLPSTLE